MPPRALRSSLKRFPAVMLAGMFKQDRGLNAIFAASSVLFLVAGGAVLLAYLFFMNKDVARAAAFTSLGIKSAQRVP